MFRDRTDGGRRLADLLGHLQDDDVVVVGLPRGGVPVAHEVAVALGAPLDIIVVRKIGAPGQPELAMGAVGENGARVVDADIVRILGVSEVEFLAAERQARAELADRVARLRGDRSPARLAGRTVVVVDDGMATGSTARAACEVVSGRGAARVVLAVPVASVEAVRLLEHVADEVVVANVPSPFHAVGEWYEKFGQTTDAEVTLLLGASPT